MEQLKIYARTIEQEASNQILNMAKSEAYKNCIIRIMPDCHAGKGCTIGTVIKIDDKVIPNTVGVDIGCGMLVIFLGNIEIDFKKLDHIINTKVPSGFNSHETPLEECAELSNLHCYSNIDVQNVNKQIGTLGGGNHFIEVNKDDENNKYLVIHSGSRNLGVKLCNFYQNIAKDLVLDTKNIRQQLIEKLKQEGREKEIQHELRRISYTNLDCDKELFYLKDEWCARYIHDMKIVQNYASQNRLCIAKIITESMNWRILEKFETIHNYIDIDSYTLRKGAVSAKMNEKLIIPINMRDGSLICIGKGNEDWLCSAPHGAGRLMSRKKAKETLSMDDFTKAMSKVYSTSVCDSTIDESPMAYKPMEEIVECIEPTVWVIDRILPIYNFKAK
jgi:RNA-splicing ligase RtcB